MTELELQLDRQFPRQPPAMSAALVPVACALLLVVPFVAGAVLPFLSATYDAWLFSSVSGRALLNAGSMTSVFGWPLLSCALILSGFLTCPGGPRTLLRAEPAVRRVATTGLLLLMTGLIVQLSPLGWAISSSILD